MPSGSSEHGEVRTVTITMSLDEAKRISAGLADLLCWCRGFKAAQREDDYDCGPLGIPQTRDISAEMKSAIDKVELK